MVSLWICCGYAADNAADKRAGRCGSSNRSGPLPWRRYVMHLTAPSRYLGEKMVHRAAMGRSILEAIPCVQNPRTQRSWN